MPRRCDKTRLSDLDIAILNSLARGVTQKEVARQMHYSVSFINRRMEIIRCLLHAQTGTHAVVLALQRGLIRFEEKADLNGGYLDAASGELRTDSRPLLPLPTARTREGN